MFFSRPAGVKFTDRGDISSVDFDKDDFSDGWNDLDLSGIIPKNTKLVFLAVNLRSSAGITSVQIRTKGYTGDHNRAYVVLQHTNIMVGDIVAATPNSDRFLELYQGSGVTWTFLNVTVLKWLV